MDCGALPFSFHLERTYLHRRCSGRFDIVSNAFLQAEAGTLSRVMDSRVAQTGDAAAHSSAALARKGC